MKAVILAGGKGTRLTEETDQRPKPMVPIGPEPILWHIMKIYECHGITEFVVCCGHKGWAIRNYFTNYFMDKSDVTISLADNQIDILKSRAEPWKVTLVDTGEETLTGGRLKRVRSHVEDDDLFCFTYGDGVGDIDVSAAIAFHRSHGKKATLTATMPPGRFGALNLEGDAVTHFKEKPRGDGSRVNGGFFVLHPSVIDLIDGDETTWEQEPMIELANQGELMAFRHDGFWQPMDNVRDMRELNKLWEDGNAPWKTWE